TLWKADNRPADELRSYSAHLLGTKRSTIKGSSDERGSLVEPSQRMFSVSNQHKLWPLLHKHQSTPLLREEWPRLLLSPSQYVVCAPSIFRHFWRLHVCCNGRG